VIVTIKPSTGLLKPSESVTAIGYVPTFPAVGEIVKVEPEIVIKLGRLD
jgi:hypothetical protein